jgi:predicted amidohydrolase YtcJ
MTRRLLSACAVAALWAMPYAAVGDDAQILRHRRGHPRIIDLHGQTHVMLTIVGGKIVYRAQ